MTIVVGILKGTRFEYDYQDYKCLCDHYTTVVATDFHKGMRKAIVNLKEQIRHEASWLYRDRSKLNIYTEHLVWNTKQ